MHNRGHHRHHRPRSPYLEEATLFRVLSLAELKAMPLIAEAVADLRTRVHVSDQLYEQFYQTLIDNFLMTVQLLPDVGEKRTRSACLEGLGRAIKAAVFTHEQNKHDEIEVFALISAALFRRLGGLISGMVVMLSEQNGQYAGRFNLLHQDWSRYSGEFYKIRYRHEPVAVLRQQVAPLLAKQIMPELAMAWLMDHPHVFSDWLAIISEDERGAGSLSPLVNPILDVSTPFLDKLYNDDIIHLHDQDHLFRWDDELNLGEQFYAWLKDKLASMKGVNGVDDPIHRLNEGWLLDYDKVFAEFCVERDINADPVVVFRQFNHLGVTKFSGQDAHFDRYYAEQSAEGNSHTGVGFVTSMFGQNASHSQLRSDLQKAVATSHQGVVLPDTGLLPSEDVPVSKNVRLQSVQSSMEYAADQQQTNRVQLQRESTTGG